MPWYYTRKLDDSRAALQIGGVRAPSPVGELGNVEMTQAISLVDTCWQVVGPDVLLKGAPALLWNIQAFSFRVRQPRPSEVVCIGTQSSAYLRAAC